MARSFAIVVGGSGGLGAAICRQIARDGSDVALTYRSNVASAEAVAEQIRDEGREAEIARLDLVDAAAVAAFVDDVVARRGTLGAVVYAAGPSLHLGYINQITPESWSSIFRADVDGCFHLLRACLPHLRRQKSGNIVAVITSAVDRPPPRDILSAAPKAAIQALVRGIAREEGRSGIRANCVAPGWMDVGLGRELTERGDHAAYIEATLAAIPLRRAGTADDVAHAVSFLLSERAAYVTGVTIPVSGGLQL
jgi:NAD(P)-dependent dehydrogenase (short-subunit alcohol dehydrogenase family)